MNDSTVVVVVLVGIQACCVSIIIVLEVISWMIANNIFGMGVYL